MRPAGWFIPFPALFAGAALALDLPPSDEAARDAWRERFMEEYDCSKITKRAAPENRTFVLEVNGVVHPVPVTLEIADTEEKDTIGLMCRRELAGDHGMLFTRPSNGAWMFQCFIPLSVVFMEDDGKIVDVAAMKPCVRDPSESKLQWYMRCHRSSHTPREASSKMLEITPALSEKLGLKAGDRLVLRPHDPRKPKKRAVTDETSLKVGELARPPDFSR